MRLRLGALQLGPHYFTGHDEIDRSHVFLAGWHAPWSITWRWVLSYQRRQPRKRGQPRRPWWNGWSWTGGSGSFWVRLPFAGSINFSWQQHMHRDPPRPGVSE